MTPNTDHICLFQLPKMSFKFFLIFNKSELLPMYVCCTLWHVCKITCTMYCSYTRPLSPSLTEDIFESHDISIGHQFVISVNNWIFHFLWKNVRRKLCFGLIGLRTATKFCMQLPTFIQTQPSNCFCFVQSWTHQEQCMPILKPFQRLVFIHMHSNTRDLKNLQC